MLITMIHFLILNLKLTQNIYITYHHQISALSGFPSQKNLKATFGNTENGFGIKKAILLYPYLNDDVANNLTYCGTFVDNLYQGVGCLSYYGVNYCGIFSTIF